MYMYVYVFLDGVVHGIRSSGGMGDIRYKVLMFEPKNVVLLSPPSALKMFSMAYIKAPLTRIPQAIIKFAHGLR